MLHPAAAADHRRALLSRQAFCRDLDLSSTFDADGFRPEDDASPAPFAPQPFPVRQSARSAFCLSIDITHHGCYSGQGQQQYHHHHHHRGAESAPPPQRPGWTGAAGRLSSQQQEDALRHHIHQAHFFVGSSGGEEFKKRTMACSEQGWSKRRRL
jgi:hypothetical protein